MFSVAGTPAIAVFFRSLLHQKASQEAWNKRVYIFLNKPRFSLRMGRSLP